MDKHFFNRSELAELSVPSELFDVKYIHTDNLTVAFNQLKAGAVVPVHQHLEETIDYVQQGELEMTIDGKSMILTAGMVAKVPSYMAHGAIALSDCEVINIFYPARKDFK